MSLDLRLAALNHYFEAREIFDDLRTKLFELDRLSRSSVESAESLERYGHLVLEAE